MECGMLYVKLQFKHSIAAVEAASLMPKGEQFPLCNMCLCSAFTSLAWAHLPLTSAA